MPPKKPTKEELREAREIVELARHKILTSTGFAAFRSLVLLPESPNDQIDAMEVALFAGVQHLYGCLNSMVVGNITANERLIASKGVTTELNEFTNDYFARNKEYLNIH